MVQFCLYPLAVAFSNDHVEGDRRVSLTAMLLVTYGVGASIGPLVAGVLMKLFGSQMLYAFFSFFALVLVWRIRPKAVTNLHQVDDAPLHHVAMPDSMSSSPLVAWEPVLALAPLLSSVWGVVSVGMRGRALLGGP